MKHRRILLPFLLLAMFGCRHGSRVETLQNSMPGFAKVYSLKDYHPENALRVMQSIEDTLDLNRLQRQSPFLFNEYQVLRTELRYKNILPISDDTLALKAFEFYDALVTQSRAAAHDKVLLFQFARSLYYKAAVESQRDNKAEAFADYLRALGAIDGLAGRRMALRIRKVNPEYEHFTALVYDRLAWFFYTSDEWEEALECIRLSNECFEREGSALGLASNYTLMGDVMLAQGDKEASLMYYNQSDSIYDVLGAVDDFHDYGRLFHDALRISSGGDIEGSIRMLNDALSEPDGDDRISRQIHFMLAYSFLEMQEPDSALYHFDRCYPLLPRQTMKTYCQSIWLANSLGDSIKAARYGKLLADLSLERFYQKGDVDKMALQFVDYKKEKDTAIARSMFLYVLAVIMLLGVIITVQSLWIHWRRRRNEADLEQHERIKTSLEEQIAQTHVEVKLKEEKINALQFELEQAIANLDFQKLPFNEKIDILAQIPISKRALKVLEYNVKAGLAYPELVMSESQLGHLVDAFDVVFSQFSVKMIEQYPRLKRNDVVYCCLYILGLSEIQAAALTGKTYQAVWKRSNKLHEIFGNKSNLQFVLHNIIKSWK